MAQFDGVHAALATMQPLQLIVAFLAAGAVALAIDTTFDARVRQAALVAAALAAGAFVLLAAGWLSGLVLVALGAAGMALFVAAVRLLSRVLDIDSDTGQRTSRPSPSPSSEIRFARRTLPQRARPAIRAI